ncbi:FYVE, RhoGEF and PH domain-containing protein 6 [Collichthys lucidus]|uniref:FYVE, RhoGEF and PH domain-containing protein 6 n=1 Tax=Collichthys lucidus TaxID=240159 RepID=A0A4U5VQ20_COLLU|nr:FYVE, RhoGEF and PH domain-containing protein 6 [Collichthys lucidus]
MATGAEEEEEVEEEEEEEACPRFLPSDPESDLLTPMSSYTTTACSCVKKPPLAPKPKLPTTTTTSTKPSPPPIAPKPGLLSQSSVVSLSQPSPATLKRTKPAVAPKPCIPKSAASSPPVSPPPPKPSEPLILSQESEEALGDSLSLLNSRNGILSEANNKRESDYIIHTCSCGIEDSSRCQHLENGNTADIGSDLHQELLQNGISTSGTRAQEKAEQREEKGEGGGTSRKTRDKPQRQRHLERVSVNREAQKETVKHQESAAAEPDISKADVQTEAQNSDLTDSACDVAGSIIFSPHESSAESFPVECKAPPSRLHPDLQVPAAPSKPLPVPQPRKHKKPALVRQDCVEGSAQDPVAVAEELKEMREAEGSLAGLSLRSEGEELGPCDDPLTQKDSGLGDDETDAPVPPPRQTSLSPRLHRTMPTSLNKNTSHSLLLLSQPDSTSHKKEGGEHRVEEDEEDGYGDFERYPITHSLPKQIKLGCHPPLANARKAFSAEDQQFPRAPPRKPQRHSLPAPPPPSICPPAPPHANTPMRELPAPPQEKTAWRFTRPCVTFFSRQIPTRSSVPPKSRAPALGGKQRAQSFSAADLATRADSQKRSLSFRKLLELRLSVKMLPKLLAKGGQSLDCTSVEESNRGQRSLERPKSCIGAADICGEGVEELVEYENVPLYEEIPEYMNLPFHSARLGWPHDPDADDSDIYEVQDPYHGYQDHEYERSDHQRLSDIFVQKGPYLKMYSTYIRQFDNNVALLDEQCRKNTAFAAVVKEFEMSPRCASLALKHYLLKPVQRIPQYQLLLTDYLKNLPEDSEDYKDTQAALSIVKEVANHANDIMKQGDNFQKLMHIQYSLNGHHEIVQPGRVFLKEGTLMKLSRKVMQPRMFFLFNDALMYTTPVQSGQYKLNSVLSLAGMKVSKPSQEAYQNELNIESVERSFILSASSATERDEWLEAIAKAIDDYTKKKITFISSRSQEEAEGVVDSGAPLGSKAPIWIPDLRATMCMICTCEFTLTWRRHHCRACGKVVCQACSANKYYLEYLKNQPARVCDHCFAKLQENTNTENSSMSGYLNRSKGNKKQWKRLWFVIKNKVLYTYAASEDVAALESQPLLGFFLREEKNGPAQKLQFKLYHKNTLFYIFKADDIPTAQRWIEAFQEAMILEQ